MGEKQKMSKRKKILIGVGIFFLLGLIGNLLGYGDDPPKEQKTEKKQEVKQEEEEPEIDLSTSELNEENVKAVADKVLTGYKDITASIDGESIKIEYFAEDIWSGKREVEKHARLSATLFEELYKNDATNFVTIVEYMNFMDAKGNEEKSQALLASATRETVGDVNWPNFKNMVTSDYNAIKNITLEYYIHPAIQKELIK